ncbi:MAG TPA: hypothetical protein RMH99_24910, partial [Sandaracinaceae bacterium LLY-WYZ-13_1]|nr:hypothetical protein [Sandaracinaceae bacterium LLY-WYZ-13_1]
APPAAPSSPAPGPRAEEAPLGEDRGDFLTDVARAYLYPMQPMTPLIVLGVAVVAGSLGYIPLVGPFLSAGLWVSLVFGATRVAASGRDELPGMEFEGFYEMALPGVRFLLALFVPALLLGLLYAAAGAGSASVEALLTGDARFTFGSVPVLFWVAFLTWLVYLPASLILAAHSTGCLGGLNLVGGVTLIVREPIGYALTLAGVAPATAMLVAIWAVAGAVDALVPVPFVVGVVGDALALIPAMVIGRILGLFIWHHEHELGF